MASYYSNTASYKQTGFGTAQVRADVSYSRSGTSGYNVTVTAYMTCSKGGNSCPYYDYNCYCYCSINGTEKLNKTYDNPTSSWKASSGVQLFSYTQFVDNGGPGYNCPFKIVYTVPAGTYTFSSKTTFTINTSIYLPPINIWNDINVYNPSGVQDYKSGYFDLYISNTDTTYYDLTNEKETTQPYGTYFQVFNIRPYYDYYELNYVNGYDSIPTTGTYRKTFKAANECLNIYMKYKSYYRDINAWNPTQTAQLALKFDLTIKDRDGNVVATYTDCTNEPSTAAVTREYGYTGTISNIRSNLTGAYYSSNNITGTAASSFSWTYDNTTAINLYTTYYDYSLTINPNGGSYEGSTSSVTKTQKFNTTYTLSRPVRDGYVFSHWSASRGSNFDEYGLNCSTYNNAGNGAVVLTWMQSESSSGTNADVLKIVTNGSASPGAGGFYQAFKTEASHTYLQVYRLKVPTGYIVRYANNSIGTGAVIHKLTSMEGTGNWKTYIFEMTAGSSGTFSTSGFIYLDGPDNTSVTWYMAQAQVWDVTAGAYKANSNGIYRFDYATSNCTLTANWVKAGQIQVNVDGSWKNGYVYVNVNGTWKQADVVYTNVNGVWKIPDNN